MSIKKTQEEIIKEYVSKNKITGHSEILEYLEKSHNITINQSTLSRKLRKCAISKIDGYYQIIGHSNKETISYAFSQPNMIVASTLPGHANSYAYQLDKALSHVRTQDPFKSVLGTVAGDDTVLIITDGITPLEKLKNSIEKIL